MFVDKVSQKRYELTKNSSDTTFQGKVVEIHGVESDEEGATLSTRIKTPFGTISTPVAPGDRIGARKIKTQTMTGDVTVPF